MMWNNIQVKGYLRLDIQIIFKKTEIGAQGHWVNTKEASSLAHKQI